MMAAAIHGEPLPGQLLESFQGTPTLCTCQGALLLNVEVCVVNRLLLCYCSHSSAVAYTMVTGWPRVVVCYLTS